MYGLTIWSAAIPYQDGSCPDLEKFMPFFDWYSRDTDIGASRGRGLPSGGKSCRDNFLSREIIAAFHDSAIQRQLALDGYRIGPTDWQREPFPFKPFPRPGPATDRWFQYRRWYHSAERAAMRRLYLESRFSVGMGWLRSWTWQQVRVTITLFLVLFFVRTVVDTPCTRNVHYLIVVPCDLHCYQFFSRQPFPYPSLAPS